MRLILFSSEMPELKHLPSEEREEIVDAAIFSLPITLRGLGVFLVVMVPLSGVAFELTRTYGTWVHFAYLPIGCVIIWLVFLNLAQERIRELVRARNEERGSTT